VQEYLSGLDGYSWSKVNALAAEQCLSWILSREKSFHKNSSLSYRFRLGKGSFDEHADVFWAKYAAEAVELRQTTRLKQLLHKFLLSSSSTGISHDYEGWANRLSALSTPFSPFYQMLEQCWGFPAKPIFVVCAFNFPELIPELLTDLDAFSAKNFIGLNCAQIAVWFDNADALRAIYALRKQLHVEDEYWHDLLYYASSVHQEGPLKTILDVFGAGFVTEDILKEFITFNCIGFQQPALLPLVFENNKTLRVTNSILEVALEKSGYNSRMTQELLKFTDKVEVTVSLINTALEFGESTYPSMVAILNARKSTTTPSTGHFSLDVPPSIASNEDDLSVMLTMQGPGAFELTWKDVVLAKKLERGSEAIVLLLRTKPIVEQPAVIMLISIWDESLIRELLAFRRVILTTDVVRAAAGNLGHGAGIMKLLLEKEIEDGI